MPLSSYLASIHDLLSRLDHVLYSIRCTLWQARSLPASNDTHPDSLNVPVLVYEGGDSIGIVRVALTIKAFTAIPCTIA